MTKFQQKVTQEKLSVGIMPGIVSTGHYAQKLGIMPGKNMRFSAILLAF